MSFALSIALVAAQAAATPAITVEEPDPKMMKTAEIKAFNAKLPRSHPYYIRCVRRPMPARWWPETSAAGPTSSGTVRARRQRQCARNRGVCEGQGPQRQLIARAA